MSKRHKNQQHQPAATISKELPSAVKVAQATSAVKVAQAAAAIQQPLVANAATSAKPKNWVARLKAWAWRFSAAYFWLHSVLTVATGRDLLSGIETVSGTAAISLLSFLGFTPVHVGHLSLVFWSIWLLVITEFSPIQLILGFLLYVLVFPVTVLGAWLFRKTLKASTSPETSTSVSAPRTHFPLASFSSAMLVGWFVLYSGSSSRGPNMVGFLLSVALFLALLYQALDRTSPIEEQDTAFFSTAAGRQ